MTAKHRSPHYNGLNICNSIHVHLSVGKHLFKTKCYHQVHVAAALMIREVKERKQTVGLSSWAFYGHVEAQD